MSKILVTGGLGFVGNRLVLDLIRNGHHPILLIRNGQEQGGYFRWMFNEEFVEVAPTELCKTPQTNEFVKDIISNQTNQ